MLLKWSSQLALSFVKSTSTKQFLRWNHYKSLGLTPSASLAEVKAAYYRLSKIHHPDRNNGSEASAKKFRDIVAAYEVLGKTDSRRKYDREIIKNYEAKISDFSHRKKGKRVKKNLSKNKSKSGSEKMKYKMSGYSKSVTRNEQEDLETFIFRAIPLVIACFMFCKKR